AGQVSYGGSSSGVRSCGAGSGSGAGGCGGAGSSGGGDGAADSAAAGASTGGGISPIAQTSDLRTSTRDTGWIGLQPWAIVFARAPLMTPFTNSPIDCFAATSAPSFAMIVRMTRCFDV